MLLIQTMDSDPHAMDFVQTPESPHNIAVPITSSLPFVLDFISRFSIVYSFRNINYQMFNCSVTMHIYDI